ncbi:hypothetical protein BGZ82_010478 [Podila clonocystis]|nr:hypothetical protein BGZ82_010478 [Podila clonocystis]
MLMQTKRLILSFILASNLILILFYHYTSSLSSRHIDDQDEATYDTITQRAKGIVPRPSFDPNERYLAYLPHSGFHNQRITLENALLLAKYLNRTLLVPPVFLGPATEWRIFDILHRRILLQTKRGLDHCGKVPKGDPLPAECLNYYSWTTVEWDFFYDMDKIAKEQPFNVTPLNKRYMRKLSVQELEAIPERVLHMGSLFATGRVLAELPESKIYQQFLRRTMILSTPILTKTSDAIVGKLGGLGSFVGLHLRVGDGMFVEPAPENIENMFQSLVNITGIEPIPNYKIQPSSSPDTDTDANIDSEDEVDGPESGSEESEVQEEEGEGQQQQEETTRLDFDQCRARKEIGGKFTIIYIATDGVYPRRNILFRKLFDHFPCIFTLDDFSDHLAELKQMKNTDGVGLAKDLIPMVDAVVSAKGRHFMGTPKSTFSTYVQKQLHPAFIDGLFDVDGKPLA